jgi:hypothetical protein
MSLRHLSSFTPVAVAAGLLACGGNRPLERPVDPVLKVEVGQPVPDIVLPSLQDGRPASLAQFRGKKVLLHVFASW